MQTQKAKSQGKKTTTRTPATSPKKTTSKPKYVSLIDNVFHPNAQGSPFPSQRSNNNSPSPSPTKKPASTTSPPNLAYNGAFRNEEDAVRTLISGLTDEDFRVKEEGLY